MTDVDEFLAHVRRSVDETLDALVPLPVLEPRRLHEAIRWSLFAGGKRIRPAILIAAGQTFGAEEQSLLRTAAAIEMIHTYSLIHDDLPAMDNDDLRRGKATCHIQFGEATAILAGDVLQSLAFEAIADDASLSEGIRLRLISLIAAASATPGGMASGQQLDLEAEGKTLTLDEIETIHRQKTGALISASAASGAVIGGANQAELAAVKSYSDKLGLLFQITDDLLDVTQKTETLGKTAGKDAASEKATYPAYLGIDETQKMADRIYNDVCSALIPIERSTDRLRLIADTILGRTM